MTTTRSRTGVRSTRRARRRQMNLVRATSRPATPRHNYGAFAGRSSLILVPMTRERNSL